MLILTNGTCIVRDDYAIHHNGNGLDELCFRVSLMDAVYPMLQEGKTQIRETTEGQPYLVRKINGAGTYADVTCRLDLGDWEQDLLLDVDHLDRPGFSHSLHEQNMLGKIMEAPGLSGWSVRSTVQTHRTRAMEMDGPTPLEAAVQMQKTFGCALRFNVRAKTVTVLYPDECPTSNAYAVESVNLRSRPEYKGRSTELYTRIYPVGDNGLGIASVNGGTPYLDDHSYTQAVICALWKDARYTDAASLKRDAQARLEAAARPTRSWKLDVADLSRIDPSRWPDMGLDIWTKILLQDSTRNTRETVQVVSDVVYPYYPERNQVTVSTGIETLQNMVAQTAATLLDPNGELWSQINARS